LKTGRRGRLTGRLWQGPEPPRGVVIVVHGLGDQSARYASLAEHLLKFGWFVFAFDLPGHGQSPGRAGQIENFESLLRDIDQAGRTVAERFPAAPVVMLGHSMGGNLVLNYTLRRREFGPSPINFAGAALLAPMLLPPNPPPRPIILAAWLTGYVLPWLSIRRPIVAAQLTRDPAEADRMEADTSRHVRISLHLATQLLSQGRWALDHARHVDVPTLVMHGEADELIDRGASQHVAVRIGEQATLVTWPEMRHDLLHELDRELVIARLTQWLRVIEA
jgi:alpha-beta hydrolase superfamily lysophospholipase